MGFLYRKFLGGQETELQEVIRNLGYILTTKRGSGSFLRGFGISETGYRTPEEMILGLGEEIRENIEHYEPRVEVLEIEESYSEDKHVWLDVSLRLKGTQERLRLTLDPRDRSVDVKAAPGSKSSQSQSKSKKA